MNKKGVYTPDQVTEIVDKKWKKYNTDDSSFVNKETTEKVVRDCVNYLGGIGDGKKFEDEEFTKAYKKVDPLGLQKVAKLMCVGVVTSMVSS